MRMLDKIRSWWRPRLTPYERRMAAWFPEQFAARSERPVLPRPSECEAGSSRGPQGTQHEAGAVQEQPRRLASLVRVDAHPCPSVQREIEIRSLVSIAGVQAVRTRTTVVVHDYQRNGQAGPEKRN